MLKHTPMLGGRKGGHGWNGQQGGGRWQSSAEFFSFYVTNRWQRKSQSLFCCIFAMTSPSTGFAARSKLLLNSIPPVVAMFEVGPRTDDSVSFPPPHSAVAPYANAPPAERGRGDGAVFRAARMRWGDAENIPPIAFAALADGERARSKSHIR